MSDVPAPKSRFDEDGDWMARQFFSADELRLSPEEYAGRHADLWASFSLHLYRYRDKDLGKWVRRVGEVFASESELERCRRQFGPAADTSIR